MTLRLFDTFKIAAGIKDLLPVATGDDTTIFIGSSNALTRVGIDARGIFGQALEISGAALGSSPGDFGFGLALADIGTMQRALILHTKQGRAFETKGGSLTSLGLADDGGTEFVSFTSGLQLDIDLGHQDWPPVTLLAGGVPRVVVNNRLTSQDARTPPPALVSFKAAGDGALVKPVVTPLASLGIDDAGYDLAAFNLGDVGYVVVPGQSNDSSLTLLKSRNNGTFNLVDVVETPVRLRSDGRIETTVAGADGWVFAAGDQGKLMVYGVPQGDQLEFRTLVPPALLDPANTAGPISDLTTFDIGDRMFLATASHSTALDGLGTTIFEVHRTGALRWIDGRSSKDTSGDTLVRAVAEGETAVVLSYDGSETLSAFVFDPGQAPSGGGSPTSQIVDGDGGDNFLDGAAGNDTLRGGAGNDVLLGGAGDDKLKGGSGLDQIFGEAGHDVLFGGGGGDDVLVGGAGNDTLNGGEYLSGEAGRDLLVDGAIMDGGGGRDRLRAGTSTKEMHGGDGDDKLKVVGEVWQPLRMDGGKGNDRIFGGATGETLIDGAGRDLLAGGSAGPRLGDQSDTFVFVKDGDLDKIVDFEPGVDVIDLQAFASVESFADLNARDLATGVKLKFEGETLILKGLDAADLELSDFLLLGS